MVWIPVQGLMNTAVSVWVGEVSIFFVCFRQRSTSSCSMPSSYHREQPHTCTRASPPSSWCDTHCGTVNNTNTHTCARHLEAVDKQSSCFHNLRPFTRRGLKLLILRVLLPKLCRCTLQPNNYKQVARTLQWMTAFKACCHKKELYDQWLYMQ